MTAPRRSGLSVMMLSVLVAAALPAQEETTQDPFAALPGYRFGESRVALAAIEKQVREAGADRATLESRLLAALQSPDATLDARRFCCRMLEVVGSADSVPVLVPLLDKPSLAEAARRALHTMPGETVDHALLTTAQSAGEAHRVALLQSLGARRTDLAVTWIESQLSVDHDVVRRAALWALGRIGSMSAVLALEKAKLPERLRRDRDEALLDCAGQALDGGRLAEARSIYERIARASRDRQVQAAARCGLIEADPERAVDHLLGMLRETDPFWHTAAAAGVSRLASPVAVQRLADTLARLPAEPATRLIVALTDRGEASTAMAIARQLERPSPEVRDAALQAVGTLGGADQVPALARFAESWPDRVEAIAATLTRLRGPRVERTILDALAAAGPAASLPLIRSLGARGSAEAVPALLRLADSGPPEVRREACTALEPLVGQRDLPILGALLLQAPTTEDWDALIGLAVAALRRMNEEDRDHYLSGPDGAAETGRLAMNQLRGHFPSDATLAALSHAATGDPAPMVRDAALRALATWPDPAPLPLLRDHVAAVETEAWRAEVLDGLLRMAAMAPSLEPSARQELFEQQMAGARNDDERIVVLNRTGTLDDLWVLEFLGRFRDSDTLGEIAKPLHEERRSALARQVPHDASGRPVTLKRKYADKYPAGGDGALTDDQYGSTTFGDGQWQGFRGVDLVATVDLGEAGDLTDVRIGFLQDHNSWIFAPLAVELLVSGDGENFRKAKSWQREAPTAHGDLEIVEARLALNETAVTHLRVHARNIRLCPPWHPGAGKVAWLFVDEIQVNSHLGR